MTNPSSLFTPFLCALETADPLADLAAGLIGEGVMIEGPYGPKPLIYADYTASGRALMQVERFMMEHVLPYYANSHTEASFCGARMTQMRREGRALIASAVGADARYGVVFCGSGATAGINRMVALWQVGAGKRVILGPYEHHSNILPWRESGAEVIMLGEDAAGGPDRVELARLLTEAAEIPTICAFSAASNITGEIADVAGLTAMAKQAGALILWDYAGGGPYLPINMQQGDHVIDAVVLSPHKFTGGPGASGVLVLRKESLSRETPSWPGGGTVRFVSPEGHDYAQNVEAREEAGTPNVVGDIRAALAFLVKEKIGQAVFAERGRALVARAHAAWADHPRITLLGNLDHDKLPIFAFRIHDGAGRYLHQQFLTRLLSDLYGVQARGGCACAGPYVHHLLGIDQAQSQLIRDAILAGDEVEKPGFVRLNLSVLMADDKIDKILQSVTALAETALLEEQHYRCDAARAIFFPKAAA